jgi:hypothetical protein
MEIRVFEESDERDVVSLWKQVFAYSEPRNDPATVIRHKLALSGICSSSPLPMAAWWGR